MKDSSKPESLTELVDIDRVTLLSERNPCVSVGVDVLKDLSLAEWISISIECCLWKGSGLCTMSSILHSEITM
jgi:hypothetical protein